MIGAAELTDVDRFTRTVRAPATEARVRRDIDDGEAAGVESTSTLFVNGVETERMPSHRALKALLDNALAGK